MEMTVAVLFVRRDSVYKTIPGCDCYDIDRDATTFLHGMPVIAHPPCRTWGRMRHLSKGDRIEHALSLLAVHLVRANTGVLEHPSGSSLWQEAGLPMEGVDQFGGFTLKVDQRHWGHLARKSSLLYVCGCRLADVPAMPLNFDAVKYVVDTSLREHRHQKYLPKSQRDRTPPAFAAWLVLLARRCGRSSNYKA